MGVRKALWWWWWWWWTIFSRLPLIYDGGQFVDDNKQVGGNGVAIEETCEKMTNDDIIVEEFSEKQRYLTKEQRRLGQWWTSHILSQHIEERANVAIFQAFLS
jgi:hypothetical protein